MRLPFVCFLALLLLILPASADYNTVSGTTSYNGVADTGYVYSLIVFDSVDISEVSSISLDSSTYTFNVSISNVTSYTCLVNATFYSKVSGNTSYYSDTWYHYSLSDAYFSVGSEDYITGYAYGGTYDRNILFEEGSTAPSEFTFTSDAPVDLILYQIPGNSDAGFTLSGMLLGIVKVIPVIGPYLSDGLVMVGYVLSAFFSTAYFIVKNWAILLMTFETFVLLHAITLLQGRGKQSKKIAKALRSIASDNKAMIEFVVNAFVRILQLIYTAIQAIGAWIPFT